MAIRRGHTDAAQKTALSSPINNSILTVITPTLAGWPDGAIGPFVATIGRGLSNEEKVLCSGSTSGTTTIVAGGRGYGGTTPQAHSAGEDFEHTFSGLEA